MPVFIHLEDKVSRPIREKMNVSRAEDEKKWDGRSLYYGLSYEDGGPLISRPAQDRFVNRKRTLRARSA